MSTGHDRVTQRSPRRIMHVDMDAFFASLEQVRNPHLQGRPVIVGGSADGRGVVSTASYETRPYGVHSGMSARSARRLCPQAMFVGIDGRYYAHVSRGLKTIYNEFTPRVQATSVDEAFLDVTGSAHLFGGERGLALQLKDRIRDTYSLSCSIGVAPNKLLAKLASSVFKPDGLTIIDRDNLDRLVYPLPVEELWGIGPAALKSLQRQGLITLGDLAGADPSDLRKALGKNGERVRQILRAQPVSEVLPVDEQPHEKSIGHERTFPHDISSLTLCEAALRSLADSVGRRMRRGGVAGRTVALKYRFADFETHTSRITLPHAIHDSHAIFTVSVLLFRRQQIASRPLRLLGISVSRLTEEGPCTSQHELFEASSCGLSQTSTDPVADAIRDRYGESAIFNGMASLAPVH